MGSGKADCSPAASGMPIKHGTAGPPVLTSDPGLQHVLVKPLTVGQINPLERNF